MRFKYMPEALVIVIIAAIIVFCLCPWPLRSPKPFPDPEKWEREAVYWDHGDKVEIWRPKGPGKKFHWGPKHGP